MANSQGSYYTRGADKREADYRAFEANAVGAETVDLLVAPGVNKKHKVHEITITVGTAAAGTVTIQDETGNVLVKAPTDNVGSQRYSFGPFPWGFNITGNEKLQAVNSAASNLTIQGYATS